jgi:hypothetical protein
MEEAIYIHKRGLMCRHGCADLQTEKRADEPTRRSHRHKRGLISRLDLRKLLLRPKRGLMKRIEEMMDRQVRGIFLEDLRELMH